MIPFKIHSKPGFMESYWCMKKNSIVNWINNGVDFDPALAPCLKSECQLWDNGKCFYLQSRIKKCKFSLLLWIISKDVLRISSGEVCQIIHIFLSAQQATDQYLPLILRLHLRTAVHERTPGIGARTRCMIRARPCQEAGMF